MDPDPEHNVGRTDLSGESDFHPAAPFIVATPAVTHPGAGPSSAMVTRSRARGGRETNVEPEMEFFPDVEIPAETDEEVSGATRHLTDIASQYIRETAITQEVTTSASITTSRLPPIPRNTTPHNLIIRLLPEVTSSSCKIRVLIIILEKNLFCKNSKYMEQFTKLCS